MNKTGKLEAEATPLLFIFFFFVCEWGLSCHAFVVCLLRKPRSNQAC